MNYRIVLLLSLAALLGGCGADNGAPDPAASGSQPAPAAETAPAPAEAPAPVSPETEPAPAPSVAAIDDPAPVEVEVAEPPSAGGVEQTPAPAPASWKFATGKHYSELTSAQGKAGGPGGIEVTEVFWYGCPHCFSFDPIITRWEDEQPGDVRFVRLPVMWNPTNEIHARMYYTAEALDKLNEMHEAIFTAMHKDGKTLTRESEIRDFFEKFGVSGEEFDQTFRSFTVESKLKRAKDLTARYRIRSVPVVVVDGKYIVDGPEVKSYGDMLAVTDELVAKERTQR